MPKMSLAYTAVIKLVYFKEGALLATSSLAAIGITGFGYYSRMLLEGVVLRNLLIITAVQVAFLFLFMIFTTADLITGIQTAFYLNRKSDTPIPSNEVIQSSKLWSTFWKSFGIITLTFLLVVLSIFTVLIHSETMFWMTIWALVCFWLMACGFEFFSIGENIAKRNKGKKAPIFKFVDKILGALQNSAIKKIEKGLD